MTIAVVTGASGYIASELVKQLLEKVSTYSSVILSRFYTCANSESEFDLEFSVMLLLNSSGLWKVLASLESF